MNPINLQTIYNGSLNYKQSIFNMPLFCLHEYIYKGNNLVAKRKENDSLVVQNRAYEFFYNCAVAQVSIG